MLIVRGQEKRSTLDVLLSQLLLEYEREGIITVANYDEQITSEEREIAEELITYWEREIPNEFRNLGIELLRARQEHLKLKRRFLDVTEPMYKEITDEIKVRDDRIQSLKQGEIPLYAREGVKHCVEHVLFTDRVNRSLNLPVFEWPGYSKVRQWLLSIPSYPSFAASLLQNQSILPRTTESLALDAFFELFVGAEEVTDEKQLKKILQQRHQLKSARQEIKVLHDNIWRFVNSQSNLEQQGLLDEFQAILRERVSYLQKQFSSITMEREAAKRKPLSRIVTTVASTAISLMSILVPVPGVADKISEKLGEWVAESTVGKKYPQLAWMYVFQQYTRLYEDSLLERANISIKVTGFGQPSDVELRESDFCATLGIDKHILYRWLKDDLLPPPFRSWQGWEVYSSKHINIGQRLLTKKKSS